MDINERITNLEQQLNEVEAKRDALRALMDEARSQEDDLFSWLANQELNGQYPGKKMGLTVGFDGRVWFQSND